MQLSKQKLFEEHSTRGVSLTHFVQTEADTHLLLQAVVWACSFVCYIDLCCLYTTTCSIHFYANECCELDRSGSVQEPETGICEHGNEPQCAVTAGEFLEYMNDC
jgi:hypothetical protein